MNDNGVVFNQNAKNIAFDNEHYEMMMSRYQQFMHNNENYTNYYSDFDFPILSRAWRSSGWKTTTIAIIPKLKTCSRR